MKRYVKKDKRDKDKYEERQRRYIKRYVKKDING